MLFRTFALVLLAVLPAPAFAAVTRYPASLRVELSKAASTADYVHQGPGVLNGPPCEASVSFVGKQARDAYLGIAKRLFQPEGAGAALQLTIEAVQPAVELHSDGWHAVVSHRLTLRDPDGDSMGSWIVEGSDRVEGAGERAVPDAFAAAAELAARRFEARLEEPPEVTAFLQRNGVAAGVVPRRSAGSEPPPPPPPPEVGPPRPPAVVYLDLGGGFDAYTMSSSYRGDQNGLAPGLDARLGVATKWAFLQAGFSRWDSREQSSGHTLTSFGIDGGLLVRFSRMFEVGLGLGVQSIIDDATDYALGPQPISASSQQWVPNVMVAMRVTPPVGAARLRFSFEARARFQAIDTTVSEKSPVDVLHLDATWALALMIGGELPLGKASR